ncbi:type II secretion system protein N [Candidimonas nitroreducens]|nr:type II secretion system protein N [Candidimonas nitroreducens]
MTAAISVFAQWLRPQGPRLLQGLAMLALACGAGLWGALLLAPRPAAAPPMLAEGAAPGQSIEPLVGWFGGASSRLRLKVVGLIAAGERGTALLSINGGAAEAYHVGESLAPGVTLVAVRANAVSIGQDGLVEEVAAPEQALPANGFVPVGKQSAHH